jgi:hypothetical protein
MTRLRQLHDRYGQSSWLDNRTRGAVTAGHPGVAPVQNQCVPRPARPTREVMT